MKIGHRIFAGLAASALCATCLAQAAGLGSAEPAPGITAPGAAECAKPANKAMPGCNGDKGINLQPPPAVDPAIKRTPPSTGDPIANPQATAPGDDKKTR